MKNQSDKSLCYNDNDDNDNDGAGFNNVIFYQRRKTACSCSHIISKRQPETVKTSK